MVLFEFDGRSVKKILLRIIIFGIPLLVGSYLILTLLYHNQLNSIKTYVEKQQEEIVLLYKYNFDAFFNTIYDDLNVVARSNEFNNYFSPDLESNKKELEKLFERILKSKQTIYQIRYLTIDGMEAVRVERTENKIIIVNESDLQNKKDRYYFKNLSKVDNGEMYISDFDLNIENGVIELPYRPTIRFSIPIYSNNEKVGFLIVNMDGLKVLEVFKEHEINEFNDIKLGLLDKSNLISLNMVELKNTLESSFMRNEEGKNPIHDLIDYNSQKGRFKFNNNNYYYRIIDDYKTTFTVVFDETWGNWTVLSSYNESDIIFNYGSFLVKYPNFKIIFLIIQLILTIMIFIFITSRETEHLLLMATGIVSDFSHDGILITSSNKKIVYCNKIFETLFGYELHEIKGKSPKDLSKSKSSIIIDKASKSEIAWEGNIWDISSDGVYIQRYLRMRTVRTSNGSIAYYIGIYSEPRISESDKEYVQGHISSSILNIDTLKYLPPLFKKTDFDNENKLVVISLRITEYAILRNVLTEIEENTLVKNLSKVMKSYIEEECAVFSPSAGLVFMATILNEKSSLASIMSNIDYAVSSMRFSERTSQLEYLSGVAISPDHGTNMTQLMEKSYIALDAITRIKNVKYLLYNQDIFNNVEQHYKIINQFDNAYLYEEFTVVYQPQNNSQTKEIVGVEALVRWNNSVLGVVSPFDFIPVMEEFPNQIKKLGKYILKKVITECECMLPFVSDNFRFSVNLSSQEFADLSLVLELVEIIQESNFPKERICFEITETVLSEDLNQTSNIISMLHKNNITVAIDDFGTGYSSLGYLKKLNADKLKIDMIFIRDYPEKDDGSIIKAIAQLSHEMGVKVIVEGIETEEQLSFLIDLGCQEFQGYLSSKPIPAPEILEILKKDV